jgi:cysteine desulfurase
MIEFLTREFGNAASRTHDFGTRAKKAVESAREAVAAVVAAKQDEVVFTSGATESNNLAILGLASHGDRVGRRHIITTALEHKAVLEPAQHLATKGFDITVVAPDKDGWVSAEAIQAALRPDTLLVSVMHANNETGILQPVEEISEILLGHEAFFHVDAAQTFGKEFKPLQLGRVDLISVSGHKIYGPKGIGALVVRRRGFHRLPLEPLMHGGGHERGLRPGTLPVSLIAGLGTAAKLASSDHRARRLACLDIRSRALAALSHLEPLFNGDQARSMPHVLNLSIPGLDSEAVIVALKDIVAFSNGSACTSHSYQPSHVLKAMGLSAERTQQAIRLSWCHMTPEVPWNDVVGELARLKG